MGDLPTADRVPAAATASTALTDLPDQVGGRLSLDFLNSVDPRHSSVHREYFASYPDVLRWARSVAVLPEEAVARLEEGAAGDLAAAQAAHRYVLTFRDALYQVMAAALEGRQVFPEDLARVNLVLRRATARHQLLPGVAGGVRDGWVLTGALEEVLWPVAVDAWDLLTGPPLERVRECPGDGGQCGWLFLDASRSGTRKWCDMRTCGNRAKVRAHYRAHYGAHYRAHGGPASAAGAPGSSTAR
jgi:predicted RNA-binding Zn ribbon-like protein